MMSPGESIRLNVETGKFVRTQVNASQSKAWAENRIEFDHITLKELVAKLSRQYDVNIRLESESIGDKTFRISLRNRETDRRGDDCFAGDHPDNYRTYR